MAEKKIHVVGMDDGFLMTNIVLMNAGAVVSKSAINSRARWGAHANTDLGSFGSAQKEICSSYETEDGTFTVGNFHDSESVKFDDYPVSGMNRAIINHALRVAGLGGQKIRMATGLPISMFYKNGQKNTDLIQRKIASGMKAVKALDGSHVAEIIEHQVFPEGLSAWVDNALDDKLKLRVDLSMTSAVIDIGGRTTDTAVILPGRQIDHSRSGSKDIGVINVIEMISEKLSRKFSVDIPIHFAEQAIESKVIHLWGKKHDVSNEVETSKLEVSEQIMREVNRKLGSAVDVGYILLVGGGARVFKDIDKRYPNILIPDDPEYANARGFAKYMQVS